VAKLAVSGVVRPRQKRNGKAVRKLRRV